jgi:hypothetical protein
MPIERGDLFEDPLNQVLQEAGLGEISGGGTAQNEDGEIEYVGIDVELTGDVQTGIQLLLETLEELGAPIGSQLEVHEGEEVREIRFGSVQGIGVYLDGTGLPAEVYANSDVNFVVEEIDRLCEGVGGFMAHWQGPTETALYVYGESADVLTERIQPLLASYPLCAGARVVRVA